MMRIKGICRGLGLLTTLVSLVSCDTGSGEMAAEAEDSPVKTSKAAKSTASVSPKSTASSKATGAATAAATGAATAAATGAPAKGGASILAVLAGPPKVEMGDELGFRLEPAQPPRYGLISPPKGWKKEIMEGAPYLTHPEDLAMCMADGMRLGDNIDPIETWTRSSLNVQKAKLGSPQKIKLGASHLDATVYTGTATLVELSPIKKIPQKVYAIDVAVPGGKDAGARIFGRIRDTAPDDVHQQLLACFASFKPK